MLLNVHMIMLKVSLDIQICSIDMLTSSQDMLTCSKDMVTGSQNMLTYTQDIVNAPSDMTNVSRNIIKVSTKMTTRHNRKHSGHGHTILIHVIMLARHCSCPLDMLKVYMDIAPGCLLPCLESFIPCLYCLCVCRG
jgi:hypothetical protein